MKNNRIFLTAAAFSSLVCLLGNPCHARQAKKSAKDLRIEELEKRLSILEQRLEQSQFRQLPQPEAATADTSPVKQLDQKLKVIERKLEVDKEVAQDTARKTPKLEAGAEGVRFTAPGGEHMVRLRGSVQGDGKFFMDDNAKIPPAGATGTLGNNLPDRFELRQARVWLEGNLWKNVEFKIMPEFGGGNVRLFDAYIDAHYFSHASLNVGKQKTPISLERLQGDSDGSFLERAYPTYLASNRDVGIMLHGEWAKPGYGTSYGGPVDFKNFLSYQLGVFNGSGDNGNGDTDIKDDKEFAGRLWAHPFQHSGLGILEGLGLGIAGSWEDPRQKNTLNNLVTPLGQSKIVDYAAQPSANTALTSGNSKFIGLDGNHYRVYPQAYWYWGPYGLLAEYVLSSQEFLWQEKNSAQKNVRGASLRQDNEAWQVQLSYVLTGEDNTFQSVKPRTAFDPEHGHWGALQLVSRWSELDVDADSYRNLGSTIKPFYLLDPGKSISHASSWALGTNWFLNRNFRIMAEYEQTYFKGGAGSLGNVLNRPMEKVFGTRFQLVF
jgi:phosphate-selective porin OprO/OprP